MFSVLGYTIKFATWDLLRDILRFPAWWYTDGLQLVWHRIFTWIMQLHHRLGLGIWIKNWFKPMYAQYDWQGRLISFFFRTLTILWKSIQFIIALIVYVVLFLVYVILPSLAVVMLLITAGAITLS